MWDTLSNFRKTDIAEVYIPPQLSNLQKWETCQYTDCSKMNDDIRVWVYEYGMRRKFSFSLGKNTMVLQAAVPAFKACAVENICNAYKFHQIVSQAVSKAILNGVGLPSIPCETR
jgi:hypothetical protein